MQLARSMLSLAILFGWSGGVAAEEPASALGAQEVGAALSAMHIQVEDALAEGNEGAALAAATNTSATYASRLAAVTILAKDPQRHVDGLRALLAETNVTIRLAAARALVGVDPDRAAAAARTVRRDAGPPTHAWVALSVLDAVEVLAETGDASGYEQVVRMLSDPSANVRAAALVRLPAFHRFPEFDASGAAVRVIEETEPRLQTTDARRLRAETMVIHQAFSALEHMKDEKALPALDRLGESRNTLIRDQALWTRDVIAQGREAAYRLMLKRAHEGR